MNIHPDLSFVVLIMQASFVVQAVLALLIGLSLWSWWQIFLKLFQLNRAITLDDLSAIPGNRLEALKRDRKGRHSIRINDQYRICFRWRDREAFDIEITDYR